MHTRGSSPDGAGSHLLAVQRSNNTGDQEPKGRLLFDTISGSQKGWQNAACDQSKSTECFCQISALQNGGNPSDTRPDGLGRLADTHRSQRCILCCPNSRHSPEVSDIHMATTDLPIHTCLPFGLSSVPRIFTKLLKPVVAYLRSKGVRCMIYIDDILLIEPLQTLCWSTLE